MLSPCPQRRYWYECTDVTMLNVGSNTSRDHLTELQNSDLSQNSVLYEFSKSSKDSYFLIILYCQNNQNLKNVAYRLNFRNCPNSPNCTNLLIWSKIPHCLKNQFVKNIVHRPIILNFQTNENCLIFWNYQKNYKYAEIQ